MIILFIVANLFCLVFSKNDKLNLVCNGSFEFSQTNGKARYEDWTYLEDYAESKWYVRYSTNCSGYLYCQNTPSNDAGFQLAIDGNSYAGIGFYSPSSEQKEYLVGSLHKPLIKGVSYSISFYVNLANCSGYSINSFGAALISEQEVYKLSNRKYKPITNVPLAANNDFSTSNEVDTVSWKKIEGTITAKGGEQKILIGCFKKDTELIIEKKRVGRNCKLQDETIAISAYYLIDDVTIKELK